jgi:hypothetical protein
MIISDKLFFTLSHNGKLSNRTFIEARSCARLKKSVCGTKQTAHIVRDQVSVMHSEFQVQD